MKENVPTSFTKKMRTAIADYMWSEGCSCCRGSDHEKHAETLGKLLRIPKYKDGSGYDFSKYRTKKDEK